MHGGRGVLCGIRDSARDAHDACHTAQQAAAAAQQKVQLLSTERSQLQQQLSDSRQKADTLIAATELGQQASIHLQAQLTASKVVYHVVWRPT